MGFNSTNHREKKHRRNRNNRTRKIIFKNYQSDIFHTTIECRDGVRGRDGLENACGSAREIEKNPNVRSEVYKGYLNLTETPTMANTTE